MLSAKKAYLNINPYDSIIKFWSDPYLLVTAGLFLLTFQYILYQICQCGLLSLHKDACPEYPCTGPDRKDSEDNDPDQTRNWLPHRNGNGRGHAHDHEHRGEGREKR